MATLQLYYATNRGHVGKDRFKPTGYGKKFSDDGMENLRFGRLTVQADDAKIKKFLNTKVGPLGSGNGEDLGTYLADCAEKANIQAYPEKIDDAIHQASQPKAKLGSLAMFADLKSDMEKSSDVVLFIHGFNVSWKSAVGSALALQLMLQNSPAKDPTQNVIVVLFTWPSDGLALPWVSYKSDRSEAKGSGAAMGRAFLKLRDYLAALRDRSTQGTEQLCGQDMHLLCHSMGNYLLQHALERVDAYTPGDALPRLFEHVFLCAPDVDDSALEEGKPMAKLHEIARHVTVYHNKGDFALVVSDYTKGNPDRLGSTGAAHPLQLHRKIDQIDCTPLVKGLVEHSYFLNGFVNADIRQSIDGVTQDEKVRRRVRHATMANVWTMK
jgi:esterase/lipase superfamily enzyme